jgi:hypothetical protein
MYSQAWLPTPSTTAAAGAETFADGVVNPVVAAKDAVLSATMQTWDGAAAATGKGVAGVTAKIAEIPAAGSKAEKALKASVAALGLDYEQATTGMSTANAKLLASFDEVSSTFGRDSDTMIAAVESLLSKLDSQAELAAFKQRLVDGAESGVIAFNGLESAISAVDQKLQALNVSDIDAAFKALGQKTLTELKTASDLAIKNFDLMRTSGLASAQQLAAAWPQVKAAVTAALGETGAAAVLDQLQYSTEGLTAELNKAGAAGSSAGQSIAAGMGVATQAVRQLKSETERLKEQHDAAIEASDKVLENSKAIGSAAKTSLDSYMSQIGSAAGLSGDALAGFVSSQTANDFALSLTSGMGPILDAQLKQRAASFAARVKESQANAAYAGLSNYTPAATTAPRGQIASGGNTIMGKTTTIKFQAPGGKTVAGQFADDDAAAMVALLKSAGASTK